MIKNKLSLTVQYVSHASPLPTRVQFRRWVRVAVQRDVTVTLRIVDEEEGHALNKAYRGRDDATNVLTFVYDDEAMPSGAEKADSCLPALLGDVVICAPVVAREAAIQHKDLWAHYAHLTIHAMLHLQGYDHENDPDAEQMEALETRLMVRLRYLDPYMEI
ncbi:MAG: rRNA maturation RNase YbeY [Gallionella sp.]